MLGKSFESKLLRAASTEKMSCLQKTVSLLNQCIGEENQGPSETDKELKILGKGLQKIDEKSFTLKLCQKKEKLKQHLMILEKMRSCLRKLEPEFWTYSLIRWAQAVQMLFLSPRSQSQANFWDFIILLNLFYLKILEKGRVLELWLGRSSGPNWPKSSF